MSDYFGIWEEIFSGASGVKFKRDQFTATFGVQTYTLSHTPLTDSENVIYNGVPELRSIDGYSISGNQITFNFIVRNNRSIIVLYAYQ